MHRLEQPDPAKPRSNDLRRRCATRIESVCFAVLVAGSLLGSASAQLLQQGPKLIPSDITGAPNAGYPVAISQDGNTAVIGGPSDNNGAGAVWVFTRSGTTWSQQGTKLVGTGATGSA